MGKIKNKKRSNIYRKPKNKIEVLNIYESPSYENQEEDKNIKDNNSIIEIDNEKEQENKIEKQKIDSFQEEKQQEQKIENKKETQGKTGLFKKNINPADALKVIAIVFFGVLIVALCIKYISTNFSSEKQTAKNNNDSIEYKIVDYNNNDYEYKLLKTTSVIDNITLIDKDSNKEIQYAFKIYNGKVIVNNGKKEYEIKTIKNAERLTITTSSNVAEYSSVFVITSDGKVYSISLYDNKYNLIKDNKKFEKTISSYKINSKIIDMSFGAYTSKEHLDEINIILLTDDKGKQYVLTK